jgi:hypothetical protein
MQAVHSGNTFFMNIDCYSIKELECINLSNAVTVHMYSTVRLCTSIGGEDINEYYVK